MTGESERMSLSVHRQGSGEAWRSLRFRAGSLVFMASMHERWGGFSLVLGRHMLSVQLHGTRLIVHVPGRISFGFRRS